MANILVQWLLVAWLHLLHPFYVSVIDINHNATEKSVEVSVRIFSEDLEKVLTKNAGKSIDLTAANTKKDAELYVNNYIQNRMKIKLNGKILPLHFLGFEQISESTWCYFEAENITEVPEMEIYCSLLHDYVASQINIIHAKANGKDASFKLDYPKDGVKFTFK